MLPVPGSYLFRDYSDIIPGSCIANSPDHEDRREAAYSESLGYGHFRNGSQQDAPGKSLTAREAGVGATEGIRSNLTELLRGEIGHALTGMDSVVAPDRRCSRRRRRKP